MPDLAHATTTWAERFITKVKRGRETLNQIQTLVALARDPRVRVPPGEDRRHWNNLAPEHLAG